MRRQAKKKFYQSKWFLWLMLVFIPPVGIILLWAVHRDMKTIGRILLSIVFFMWFMFAMAPKQFGNSATVTNSEDIINIDVQNSPVNAEVVTVPPQVETSEGDPDPDQALPTVEPEPSPVVQPEIFSASSGTYIVGEDISPGLYYLECDGSFSGYYSINKDSTGEFQSILDNDNFDTFTFVNLEEGNYFTFDRAIAYHAETIEPLQPDIEGYYGDGKYRVGIDIPAGEYKLEATNNDIMGYWGRSEGANGFMRNIIANDNFTGTTYVTVKDGEFFTVTRARFLG